MSARSVALVVLAACALAVSPALADPSSPPPVAPSSPAPVDQDASALSGASDGGAVAPSSTHEHEQGDSRFSFKVAGGAAYQRILSSYIGGATMQVALGGEFRAAAVYGGLSALFGATEFGLGTRGYQLRGGGEVIFGRVRVGAELRVGYLGIERTSGSPGPMTSVGIGLGVTGSVDLFRFDEHAMFLAATLSGDTLGHGMSMWGPSGVLGFRF